MQPEDQPDLFAPPPPAPRIGDSWLCAGERMCQTPADCYPPSLPEERRL